MICDRCHKEFEGIKRDDCTFGYYDATYWFDFSNPGELVICDMCMWHDPRYIRIYGVNHV